MPPWPDLHATTSLEVEIALTGTLDPGSPMVREGPMAGPAQDASVSDVEITAIDGLRHKTGRQWDNIDLLKGVDRKSEAYRQICANILEFVGRDAEDALLESMGDEE